MIIRDKQDLRKCVKQSVRRAAVAETAAKQSVVSGGYGVSNWLGRSQDAEDTLHAGFLGLGEGSPFAANRAELLAALDALNLPVHDLDKAQAIISGFDRETYLSNVLEALRACSMLIETEIDQADAFSMPDDRMSALLVARETLFAPGRYGVDYANCAQRIVQAAQAANARDVRLGVFDENALAYCMVPVCEDAQLVLHIHLSEASQWQMLRALLAAKPQVRALVSAQDELEPLLIKEAASMQNMLVRIENPAHIQQALLALGTRFVPYASHAATPEELLGRWIRLKETLWQSMCDAYLPLARTGYELTREQIEDDARLLLGGNLKKLYE